MRFSLALFIAVGTGLAAQNLSQITVQVVGSSYVFPTPFPAAPGQLVTLIAYVAGNPGIQSVRAPGGADLPTSLGGVSGIYGQLGLGFQDSIVPILEVRTFLSRLNPLTYPLAAGLAMITIQMPLEAQSFQSCAGCFPAVLSVNGAQIDVQPLADQVHILTGCEAFMTSAIPSPLEPTGLPCPSIVTHADGSRVSAQRPAKDGKELIAYAVGLGQTTPPLATGKLVTAAAPAQTTFTLDFNYHPNALPSKPLPTAPQPIYAGATPGYVGLYQVNFVVPPVPPGTPACVDASTLPPGSNVVQSNLTVSVGGTFSFDGARICVAVPSP